MRDGDEDLARFLHGRLISASESGSRCRCLAAFVALAEDVLYSRLVEGEIV